MSSALHAVAPTRDELAQDIRQHLPAMFLFHDCAEWLPMEVFGRTQYLPPYHKDLHLVPHPVLRQIDPDTKKDLGPLMVQANGRLAVRDTYGIKRDARTNKPLSVGLLEGQNAPDVVIYAVETYGERGVVWLRGDDSDAERMDKSRKLYMRFVRGWAEGERAARAELVRRFLDNPANKGRVPPPPKPNQIRAQEILDNQDSRERTAAHICLIGYDWEGDDWDAYARHMKAAHAQVVTRPRDDGAEPTTPAKNLSQAEIDALQDGGGPENPMAEVLAQPVIPEQLEAAAQTAREHLARQRGVDPAAAALEGARPTPKAQAPEPKATTKGGKK